MATASSYCFCCLIEHCFFRTNNSGGCEGFTGLLISLLFEHHLYRIYMLGTKKNGVYPGSASETEGYKATCAAKLTPSSLSIV